MVDLGRGLVLVLAAILAGPAGAEGGAGWQMWTETDPITGRDKAFVRLDPDRVEPPANLFLFAQCIDGTLSFWIVNDGRPFLDEFPDAEGDLAKVEYRANDSEHGAFMMAIARTGDEVLNVPAGYAASFAIVKTFRPDLADVEALTNAQEAVRVFSGLETLVLRVRDSAALIYTGWFAPADGGAAVAHLADCY